MKKSILTIFFVMLLSIIPLHPVCAAGDMPRLVDAADLLTDDEEMSLLYELDEISERQRVDIVVLTLDSLEGESIMEYADDFYDYYEYGFGDRRDGVLFLISMEEREWYISTSGYGITAVTDAGREYMSERFTDDLSEGDYAGAFETFAGICDDFITLAKEGMPYGAGGYANEPFHFALNLGISFAIGIVISLIVTGIMRSQLKTVHRQSVADDYIKKDSFRLTKTNDLFLYRHIERRKKEDKDSTDGAKTHTSSSSATHGGGGGKF